MNQQIMQRLEQTLQDELGLSLEALAVPICDLYPIKHFRGDCREYPAGPNGIPPAPAVSPHDAETALLWGTREALALPILTQMQVHTIIDQLPNGYFMIGFWGHGVDSYAFYYIRVDAQARICFRLPYGGVYMDNKQMSHDIRRFFSNYFTFERALRDYVCNVTIVESMGLGLQEIVLKDGSRRERQGSLLTAEPAIWRDVMHVLLMPS